MLGEKIKKIVIVDDHPIVSRGLKDLLNIEDDFDVVAFADDAESGKIVVKEHSPDIAIVDISLKNGDSGIELTRELSHLYPKLAIMILSMHDEQIYAERAIRAGAKGYIMKHEMTGAIVDSLRDILKGKIFLSEKMSSRMLSSLIGDKLDLDDDPVKKLTNREFEVFQLIGDGLKSSNIAEKLNLSPKTVDTYKMRIKSKFGLNDSTELVKMAIEWASRI